MLENTETITFRYKNITNFLWSLFLIPIILIQLPDEINHIFQILIYSVAAFSLPFLYMEFI